MSVALKTVVASCSKSFAIPRFRATDLYTKNSITFRITMAYNFSFLNGILSKINILFVFVCHSYITFLDLQLFLT